MWRFAFNPKNSSFIQYVGSNGYLRQFYKQHMKKYDKFTNMVYKLTLVCFVLSNSKKQLHCATSTHVRHCGKKKQPPYRKFIMQKGTN